MELKWLYTSIPNSKEIVSVKENYDHYPRKPKPAKIIRTLLALRLTRSNFLFNAKFYFKIKSCAMGTIRILSNSNIFMSEFEKKICLPSNQKQLCNILTLHRRHFYGMDQI